MKLEYVNKPIFVTCVLGILLYCGFYFLDVLVYPQYVADLFPIRIVVASWMIFCLFLFFRFPENKIGLFAFLFLFPAAYGISLMCFIVGEGFASPYYAGVILVIIGSSLFTRMSPLSYRFLIVLILAQHFFQLSFLPFTFWELMMNVFVMGSAAVLSVFIQACIARYENALLQSQEKLYLAATTDPLTGLLNRRKLIELLQREKTRSQRSGRAFVVAIADIDNFKFINDEFGYEDGDVVLVDVAKLLTNSLRMQDFVGRWGGEEFLILLPETDLAGARLGLDRVRRLIESTLINISSGSLKVTMTFGLAASDQAGEIDEVIRLADEALYRGKHGSKNCVVIHGLKKG